MKTIPPTGFPYKWCSNYGEDEFGIWLEFSVKEVTQRMRWMNPGRFTMGSPYDEAHRHYSELQHEVRLSKGFWMTDTACTQRLWLAVMGTNPSKDNNTGKPVDNVCWMDCDLFLSKVKKIAEGITFSLPTEAQWEYACRAGTTDPFSFGITVSPDLVNFNANYPYLGDKKGINRGRTVEVTSLPPNPWGLYETHGNVWEWCNDWYGEYESTNVTDPVGPFEGKYRVLRGGSAFSGAVDCRSAARSCCHFNGCYNRNGFRFVWNPFPPNVDKKKYGKEENDDENGRKIKAAKKRDTITIPKKEKMVEVDEVIRKGKHKK